MIIDNGAYPSPLGYCGYPKSVCTSVNECICHGIPDSRPLEDGDIINIDVTVYLNGYHGDTSATFLCGDVDDEAKKLVKVIPMVSRDHFYLLSNQYLQIENTDCEECESKFKRSN
ncbi:Methionine aminopeptidase 1D chloroplastic/mitochondrial [Zea mays]|uniref:Methionine aminopeptidase 1D chloroplastic/mitochondrial n=1 Tax=Zea mays TaxID=4577 RepID=A0A1D6HL43_MAIZE|nr:Methionine aminopeptidase 1D chloroplastic/mitochondrial [Zea mays]